jgi:hypothetical protein
MNLKSKAMDVQTQKAIIIEQFKQVNDVELINEIKRMLDSALSNEAVKYEIPKEDQNLVMERFDKLKKNPEELMDWEEAKKKLRAR